LSLRKTKGAGNAGCALHPRSRVQSAQKKAHTSIQVQRRQSDIPCAMALRLMPCSPRRRIRLVTVAAGLIADRSGRIDAATDSLAPATGVGTTRFCRTQQTPFVLRACCSLTARPPCEQACAPDAAASTASQPAFVTIAKRPFPGWDVASDSADLPDGLSETFFAEGLDSPNQFEMPTKISLYAHRIFDPIYGNHAPHLASLEILRLQFDWFAARGAGEGLEYAGRCVLMK